MCVFIGSKAEWESFAIEKFTFFHITNCWFYYYFSLSISLAHFLYIYISLSFSCSKLMKLTYLWTRAESYYIHIKCFIPVTLFIEVSASGTASKQLDKAFFVYTISQKKLIKILSACWVLVAFLDRNQVEKNHPLLTIQLNFEFQWT